MFFNTLLGFTPYRDYKQTKNIHADSPRVYTSDRILNAGIIKKIQLKCDILKVTILCIIREPIQISFCNKKTTRL